MIKQLTLLLACCMATPIFSMERTISLMKGDILDQQFNTNNSYAAIVNAANNGMQGGGGIDKAITDKGGKGLAAERRDLTCPNGEARLTHGYGINAGYNNQLTPKGYADNIKIIHTAGPACDKGTIAPSEQEIMDLTNCYNSILALADAKVLSKSNEELTKPITSITFCAISVGAFHFPIAKAGEIAIKTTLQYFKNNPQSSLTDIRFIVFHPDWNDSNTTKKNKAILIEQSIYDSYLSPLDEAVNAGTLTRIQPIALIHNTREPISYTLDTAPKPTVQEALATLQGNLTTLESNLQNLSAQLNELKSRIGS